MQTKSNILYAFTHTILGEKKSKIAKLSRSARPRSSRHSRHCSQDCALARLRGNPAQRRGTPSRHTRHTPLRVSAWAARAVARPATSCAQPPAAGLGRTPGLGRGVAKGGGEWTEADEDRGESRRPHGRETQQEGQRAGRRPTQRRANLSGGAAPPPGRDPRNAGRGSLRRQGRAWGAGLSSSFPLYVAVTSQA